MATAARPKESKAVLEPTPNTFAVQTGMLYDYYPVKFSQRVGAYVVIQKMPPVISEGYITYQKKLFHVSLRDYFRSRVNVEQPAYVAPATNTNDSGGNTAGDVPTPVVGTVSVDTRQPATAADVGFQVDKAIDLAWEDQIRTLLYTVDPEAEWEF